MYELLEEFSYITGPLISLGVTLSAIGGAALWLKKVVNSGMVSKVDFDLAMDNPKDGTGVKQLIKKSKVDAECYTDEKIAAHKEQTTKDDEADKKWLNLLQNKVEQNGKDIYELKGRLSR